MLSNIAVWMLPVAGPPAAAARAICRLLAATVTAMYVFSLVGVSVDLLAWQCAACPRRRWISWLGGVPPRAAAGDPVRGADRGDRAGG
ncbi:hypothetical protein ABZ754_23525 [Micromonospora purpureochromogenes]|uniref:hypothetical protein n=1 Tax=Micromonospora purpureochromogenes TaxID=47872 RepID=UPI0033FE7536